jgi:hypothetical protein
VVARATAKRPEDRYGSGREFAIALREALAGRTAPQAGRPGRRRPLAWVAVVAVLLAGVVAAGAGALFAARGTAPTPTHPTPPAPLIRTGVHVTATSTAPSSVDASGNVVTYAPANVVDGSYDTAWRTRGGGRGEAVTLVFDMPIDIVRIGLVPGYAKTDPQSGVNRFGQNRIITQVRYLIPGLEPVPQMFRPEPVPQFVRLNATTRRVTIEILATTAPGGGRSFDYTAISEVYVYGFEQ